MKIFVKKFLNHIYYFNDKNDLISMFKEDNIRNRNAFAHLIAKKNINEIEWVVVE